MKPFYGKTFKDIAPPTECGHCGVNWDVIHKSLLEPNTDNWEHAKKIIRNCYACRAHFYPILKKLKEERDNLAWLSKNIP